MTSHQMVDVAGRRMHARIRRNGAPTIVLEAGLACGAETWCALFDDVARHGTTIAYDRNGLMYSECAREDCRIDAALQDLHGLLAAVQAPKPYIVVGHSLGGVIARHYAATVPDDVAAMLLIETVDRSHLDIDPLVRAFRRGSRPLAAIDTLCRRYPGMSRRMHGLLRPIFDRLAERKYAPYTRAHGREVIEAVLHDPIRTLHAAYAEAAAAMAIVQGVPAALPSRSVPLTVVAGGSLHEPGAGRISSATLDRSARDRHVEAQRSLASLSDRGRFVVAENSGHVVPLEQPGVVGRELDALVRSLGSHS